MSLPTTRDLSPTEVAAIDERLAHFREQYPQWSGMPDWELHEFARYEGVAGRTADEIEPLVLGAKCVALHGCRWCMLQAGSEWRVALMHESLPEPVDLSHFNPNRLRRVLSRQWQQKLFGRPAKAR